MIKKLILFLVVCMSVNCALAMEFLGKELETLNRTELTNLLKQNGAKSIKKENLVDTFSLTGGKIPYASYAKAYYNKSNQFIGLKVIFDYDPQNLLNLRTALVKKYGNNYIISNLPNKGELEQDLFFKTVVWQKENNMSIEYSADSFNQSRFDNVSGFAYLFFRENNRKEQLVKELKEQSQKSDDAKFKGVF